MWRTAPERRNVYTIWFLQNCHVPWSVFSRSKRVKGSENAIYLDKNTIWEFFRVIIPFIELQNDTWQFNCKKCWKMKWKAESHLFLVEWCFLSSAWKNVGMQKAKPPEMGKLSCQHSSKHWTGKKHSSTKNRQVMELFISFFVVHCSAIALTPLLLEPSIQFNSETLIIPQGTILLWSWRARKKYIKLTHLAPDQLLPFRYKIPCEGK